MKPTASEIYLYQKLIDKQLINLSNTNEIPIAKSLKNPKIQYQSTSV